MIYREFTECYSISFLFQFFFHQSSLYPIKIFAKCFYLLVRIILAAKVLSSYSTLQTRFFDAYCTLNAKSQVKFDYLEKKIGHQNHID